jgi:hypothetical protein
MVPNVPELRRRTSDPSMIVSFRNDWNVWNDWNYWNDLIPI